MPKQSSTTNPSDERNTPREIVFDMEFDLTSLGGYSSLLLLAADGVAQHYDSEAGKGLIRLAHDTGDCIEKIQEWHRKLHAAVQGQDKPADTGSNTSVKTAHSTPVMAADKVFSTLTIPDLRAMPMVDLAALHDAAGLAGDALLGIVNQPRTGPASSDVLDRHRDYLYNLQDAIYNEARGRAPADDNEAEIRAKLMVERLLTWEDPWQAIAVVADEMVARADSAAVAS